MSSRQTVLMIGAGVGGIAAAARLARNGYAVTVLEKNAHPGGRCDQIIREGHRFDTGATLFLMPEIYAETYAALGERMEDHLDLRRIDPTYRIYFNDGAKLALTGDLNAMQAQLEAIEPDSFEALLRYLTEGCQNYRIARQYFIGRNFYSLPGYFSPRTLWLILKMKALIPHYANVGHYFHHPYLKAAFTFQNMYLGLSPFDAPATYSLIQYTELADGVWFPMGGMYRFIDSLVTLAEAHGARFVYNAPVKQIEVDGNRATGVILQDGSRLSADVIVANADLPYVYRHLLPDQAAADRLDRKKYTSSAIMFYWGVDKVYPQLGTHNIFLGADYRASFERIFKDNTLPEEPSFYIHAPTRVDPSAAPAGADTLMALVPSGHLDDAHPQDWEALQARARATVLTRLASIGITDLDAHLKFESSLTPRNWQNMYNLAKGAAFGLSHTVWQVGYLRPRNRHRKYRNLYFVGSSTHPGTGVPMVLLSARLTTERILKEVGVPRRALLAHPVATA